MPFFQLSEQELRDVSKRYIETLEIWLRRIIDETLTHAFGRNYWEIESHIIKKDVREKVTARIAQAPIGRFSRWIDATLIEHQISLLSNDRLYKNHFKPYFSQLFPENFVAGKEYLEFVLKKCASIRNILYHSNPVSVRQVEQIVCYTNDIVDSIKYYYVQKNMHTEFNVPSIISFSDSLGGRFYPDQFPSVFGAQTRPVNYTVRCGDLLKLSVEVDSSFNENDYVIKWLWSFEPFATGKEAVFEFSHDKVGQVRYAKVQVKSNKNWHRYIDWDDELVISFKVLPPID